MSVLFKLAALGTLLLSGCTTGFLYTNVKEPYSTNMAATQRGERTVTLSSKHISDPFTPAFSVNWEDYAVGAAAKNGDLEQVYFADLHTLSFFGGLWKKQTIYVYGK